jgi:hypothetical protein
MRRFDRKPRKRPVAKRSAPRTVRRDAWMKDMVNGENSEKEFFSMHLLFSFIVREKLCRLGLTVYPCFCDPTQHLYPSAGHPNDN